MLTIEMRCVSGSGTVERKLEILKRKLLEQTWVGPV
jgi:hypothetical protein